MLYNNFEEIDFKGLYGNGGTAILKQPKKNQNQKEQLYTMWHVKRDGDGAHCLKINYIKYAGTYKVLPNGSKYEKFVGCEFVSGRNPSAVLPIPQIEMNYQFDHELIPVPSHPGIYYPNPEFILKNVLN